MITIVDKLRIIQLKGAGYSNRHVAKIMEVNRKTVAKYWNKFLEDKLELENNRFNLLFHNIF